REGTKCRSVHRVRTSVRRPPSRSDSSREPGSQEVDEHPHRRKQSAAGRKDEVRYTQRRVPLWQHALQLSRFQIRAYDVVRELCDAEAREHCGAQHDKVVAEQPGCDLDALRLVAGPPQLPQLTIAFCVERERIELGEARGSIRATYTVQVLRTCNQLLTRLSEGAHHQTVLATGTGAHPQRNVETFIQHVHPAIADVHLQPDRRVLLQKLWEDPREHRLGHGGRAAHAHNAPWLGPRELHYLQGGIRFRQHGHRVTVHVVPDFSDGEPPGGPLQQPDIELGLQGGDVPREARFRDAQRARGLGITPVLDDLGEVVELLQGLHRPSTDTIYRTI